MAVFTHISAAEASAWTGAHFGFAADSLAPIAEGIENTNYLLRAGDARFVFTVFEKWDLPMAQYYAALMRHLAQGGAPAPSPLVPKNAAGEEYGGKPALLTPFVDGEWRAEPDAAACEKMGAAAAKLHLSAARFFRRMDNPRGAAWRRAAAKQVAPLLAAEPRELLQTALLRDAEFAELPLPAAACHCDLFRNNVLWRGGEIAGVIDFYFGGEDALVFDLAVCACDWCFVAGEFDGAKLSALLAGYESLRPFCDLERAYFNRALQSAALRFWISRLTDMHFPRDAKLLTPHDPKRFENILRAAQQIPARAAWA